MSAYLARARPALTSAETLLRDGDTIGASNRLYCRVFDAIRAVLAEVAEIEVEALKTHNGVILLFDRHILKTGLMERSLGRVVSAAQELRLSADYGSDLTVSAEAMGRRLADAIAFIDAAENLVSASGKAP